MLRLQPLHTGQIDHLIEELHHFESTLTSLSFNVDESSGRALSELPLDYYHFPNLLDLKINQDHLTNRIRLVEFTNDDSRGDDSSNRSSIKQLRVLWVAGLNFDHGTRYCPVTNRSRNLSSLSVQDAKSSSSWRRILDSSSKTLKHLDIYISSEDEFDDNETQEIAEVSFPNLQVFKLFSDSEEFPVWMKVPTSLKFLTEDCLEEMPSISQLWLFFIDSSMNLVERCPTLGTLRILIEKLHSREKGFLLDLLRKRKGLVETGKEVDGVKMTKLKQLIIPFEGLEPSELQEFRSLSEEVLDHNSKEVKGYWEVEV